MGKTIMRAGLVCVLAALHGAAASAGTGGGSCTFTVLCAGEAPCETQPEPAMMSLEPQGDGYLANMDDDEVSLALVTASDGGLRIFSGIFPDQGGAVLMSIDHDGRASFTLHADIFGGAVMTAFGTCETDE